MTYVVMFLFFSVVSCSFLPNAIFVGFQQYYYCFVLRIISTMTKLELHEIEEEQGEEESLERWIPAYLKQFIIPYHDEFCYTRVYHYRLVAALMIEGFLPIATEGVILPKLHHRRCVVSLPGGLHVSKSIRKKSKKFRLTINQNFDRVVEGCRRQHGPRCWLYPELVRVFKEIHDAGHVNSMVNSCASRKKLEEAPVRLYSIEVWNDETGEIVAGELGYTVGNIYTSLTGFSSQASAGSVQLASLGRLLCKIGFVLWDLGMDMDYKQSLGSHLMDRKDFVAHVANVRVTQGHNRLPITDSDGFNCKNLVDQSLSMEAILSGSEPSQTTVASAGNSSKVSRVDTDRQPKQKSTVTLHHGRSTPDNQNTPPQKKRNCICNKQKVEVVR
jgi:Leu/Phe-tRNA-protein transferase